MNTKDLETNTQTIERLTRERDEARSACAEMRNALMEIKVRIAYIGMPQEPFWITDHGTKVKWIALLEHALSSDCGKALLEENKRYRDALERLAVLGNEPKPGNSIGNTIAQEALGLKRTTE